MHKLSLLFITNDEIRRSNRLDLGVELLHPRQHRLHNGLVLGIYVVQYKDIFVLFLIGPIILHRLFAALFASIGYGGSRYSCYYYTAMFMLVIACIQSVILIIILFLQSIEVDSQNLPVTLAAVLDFAWGFYVLYSPLSNATDSTGYFMVPTQMYVQRAN